MVETVCPAFEKKNLFLVEVLPAVTADEIRAACGKTPEQIISLIERCILLLFPACDPEVFHIYERIIRYIQKQY